MARAEGVPAGREAPAATLDRRVRILDLDGSVTRQGRLMAALGDRADRIDLRAVGPSVRYLATRQSMRQLESAIEPAERNRLTFIGSGDFHHVTAALLKQFGEPISLVVFDTHPDWDRTSPWPCCGSWVLDALAMPNVRQIVMIGLGECDLSGWHVNVGRVKELREGRVAFYPYDYPASQTFGRHDSQVHCARFQPHAFSSTIHWNRVMANDWDTLIEEIIARLPTRYVYASVDKDCLREDAAITNWEVGGLTLRQVEQAIEALLNRKTVIGADITGEYSPIEIRGAWFRALSAWDHPRRPLPNAAELERNEATNLALLTAFGLLRPWELPNALR